MINVAQLEILRHAIGQDPDGTIRETRNGYITEPGSVDHVLCMDLVDAGLMCRHAAYSGSPLAGGGDVFLVTELGREVVRTLVDPTPRLTRSQQRYRAWLEADCGLTFREWMLMGTPKTGGGHG